MIEYKYSSYREFLGKKQIITTKSIKLLFGSSNDYIDLFYLIHNTFDECDFIDIKDKEIQEYIFEFKKIYKVEIKDLYKDRNLLQLFFNNTRKQIDAKIIEFAQILGISKKYSFKLYNKEIDGISFLMWKREPSQIPPNSIEK